jgi:hypothetical protein
LLKTTAILRAAGGKQKATSVGDRTKSALPPTTDIRDVGHDVRR